MDELLEKVNIMEISIKRFNNRISSVEQAVNDIKSEVNDVKCLKVSIEKVDKLKVQIETFSYNFGKNLDNSYTFVQENQQLTRRENLKNEAHSKRFNILIHGLKEHDSSVFETRERTEITVHEFFHNALSINSETIKFADIHHMPQYPVQKKNGKKIQQPIHCATNFRLKKSTSHIRPVLVSEMYPDSNSNLYFSRLGTFFTYYKSYFIIGYK